MRTTVLCLLLLLTALMPGADRFTIGAGAGLAIPSDTNLTNLYGSFLSPRISLNVGIIGPLFVSASAEWLSKETESAELSFGDQPLVISHRESRIHLQLGGTFPLSSHIDLLAAGGLVYFSHRDRTTFPDGVIVNPQSTDNFIETSGKRWGPSLTLMGRYRLGSELLMQAGINYSYANMAVEGEKSSLGGFTPFVELGLGF
jgi:hypothetical protein